MYVVFFTTLTSSRPQKPENIWTDMDQIFSRDHPLEIKRLKVYRHKIFAKNTSDNLTAKNKNAHLVKTIFLFTFFSSLVPHAVMASFTLETVSDVWVTQTFFIHVIQNSKRIKAAFTPTLSVSQSSSCSASSIITYVYVSQTCQPNHSHSYRVLCLSAAKQIQ